MRCTAALNRLRKAAAGSDNLMPHILDAVKAYATDFCAVKTLREATRHQVENFVAHLADWAEKDRNALLCQLNGYLSEKAGAA